MSNRREFLRASLLSGGALLAGKSSGAPAGTAPAWDPPANVRPAEAAPDEEFWRGVRKAFDLREDVININHGLSPAPRSVQAGLVADLNSINKAPLLHESDPSVQRSREESRRAAAQAIGCDAEELALTRSGTESLQIAQLGIELEPGDEVLTTREDYWSTWSVWQQRVSREGIVYREIDLGGPYPPPDEIVARFEDAFTDQTRVVLFCHMTWRTGHILPVREICEAARSRGIQTIVDGAHAFGHIPFRLADLGCDYYGTSGHKWLQAPLGTGLLYVRQSRIGDLWPPPPSWNDGPLREDIRKFEVRGSETPAFDMAVADAVRFLETLGVERKAERLHYLTSRWAARLSEHERIHVVTDLSKGRSCGIASFYVDGWDSDALARRLLDEYNIFVGGPSEDAWSGPPLVRVAPNVYTSADEVDAFAGAVEEILADGQD